MPVQCFLQSQATFKFSEWFLQEAQGARCVQESEQPRHSHPHVWFSETGEMAGDFLKPSLGRVVSVSEGGGSQGQA